uniref:F-box domain-containing protein n=2 Tax=Ascaris TaxID=6251 RepID=A0A0M3HPH8_ASCLU
MAHFTDLPTEMIVHIFEHIPSRDLWRSVRPVCRLFACIIGDSKMWHLKIRNFDVTLPTCQTEEENFHWAHCCSELERERNRWANGSLKRRVSVTGHLATVDAIRLMETPAHRKVCITGSRDRSLVVWDVNKIAKRVDLESWKLQDVPEAHQGWIWSVCKSGADDFYSCGWDRFVKQWRISNTGVEPVCSAELTAAVLCVVSDESMVISSSFDHKICAMDARYRLQKMIELEFHDSAVFDLAQEVGSPYLYSCSQDRRVVCVDKRMWRMLCELQLAAYAQSLSLCSGQLLCGTVGGKVVLLNPNNLSVVNELRVAAFCHAIRQVKLNVGSAMCLMRNPSFKIFTPGMTPKLLAETDELVAEPSRFDYYNGDLAVACGDGSVLFWTNEGP